MSEVAAAAADTSDHESIQSRGDTGGIYLDHNATTPLADEVVQAVTRALCSLWGNPSSQYGHGIEAAGEIESSRKQVARMINAQPSQIIFTSGGTESNNLVIHSAVEYYKQRNTNPPHIISTTVEHDSINNYLKHLQQHVIEVTYVPPSSVSGTIEVGDVMGAVRPNTCLVTVMLANNETGTIHDVGSIVTAITEYNNSTAIRSNAHIFTHTDAAQAIGKIPVLVDEQLKGLDFLTIAGHKFYGPRVGALYARDVACVTPLLYGGGQERGHRSGTPNTPMIIGLGAACQLVTHSIHLYTQHMASVRDYLKEKLHLVFARHGYKVFVNGSGHPVVLPNTCNVSILPTAAGNDVQSNLPSAARILDHCKDMIHASTGAACHSTTDRETAAVSPVLISYGISESVARRAIRFSVGRDTSVADIDRAVDILLQTIQKLDNASV